MFTVTLRLGFVGVGRWSRKLAESFRACGAEIVAHDRRSGTIFDDGCPPCLGGQPHLPDWMHDCEKAGFGKRMPWRDQLADKSIDAIVAVAPPEITTQVALACAAAGKAVMATKPLFDHPERITAPFYVDFWRLWSEAHQRAKSSGDGARLDLSGAGPFRDFPGAYDYGPHVMAAMLDRGGLFRVGCRYPSERGEMFGAQFELPDGQLVAGSFGNGGTVGVRNIWGETETPNHIGTEPKEAIMQKFCRSFMADVSEGFVSTTLLGYSREGMRMLEEIRRVAQ